MRKLISTLLLGITATGCSTPLPEQQSTGAWVDVVSRAGHQLSARRQDGVNTNDTRYFQLTPGAHTLELRLSYERSAGKARSQWRTCRVELEYADFIAGQRYSIQALAIGYTVRAWLYDAQGQKLQESRWIRCGML